MTSKRTDPYSKNKNPNPNPNHPAEKKHKKKNPNPDPNPSQSEEKKSKKKKSRSSTENSNPNPNPKTPSPFTPEMSSAPDSAASKKRKADEEDAIKILDAVISFQKENGGANPTPTNIRPLFDSLKDRLQADLAGPDQLYNRIRHLRQKYHRAKEATTTGGGAAASNSLFDEKFLERSSRAWGGDQRRKPNITNGSGNAFKKLKPTPPAPMGENGDNIKDDDKDGDEEMEDAGVGAEEAGGESFKFLSHQAREYWAMAGLPVETLEMGMKSMDQNKARALERKWAQHLEAALKVQAKEFEIGKELYLALIAAHKAAAN